MLFLLQKKQKFFVFNLPELILIWKTAKNIAKNGNLVRTWWRHHFSDNVIKQNFSQKCK